eukprot:IDg3916t1
MPDPTPRECVETLMRCDREVDRLVTSRGITKTRPHRVFICPRSTCTSKEVFSQKTSGYTNPYRHLLRCFRSEYELFTAVRERQNAIQRESGGTVMTDYFPVVEAANPAEKAMHAYIQLVVMRDAPLTVTEDPIYRSFCKYDAKISHKTLKAVIFALTELVEEKISTEMRSTKGAIIHDGWTDCGVHYVGLFASYCLQAGSGSQVVTPLLSMSPMAKVCSCDRSTCSCVDETTSFDAATHASHIKDIFHLFNIDLERWTVCQITDNCAVNLRISDILKIPLVNCTSHLLNLQVEAMVQHDTSLKDCVQSVHETMSDCRSRLRNRAMLRNLTRLVPVIENGTRWSGKYLMLKRFNRIYDELRNVAEQEHSTVAMNLTSDFKSRAQQYEKQLSHIDAITRYLQKKHLSVSDCRLALNKLMQKVETKNDVQSSGFFGCLLGTSHISQTAAIVKDKSFLSGVIKIQRQEFEALSDEERRACKTLLSETVASADIDNANESEDDDIIMEITKEKENRIDGPGNYINADFVLGSVAEVERLWSVLRRLLPDYRKSCAPILAEALLFLKVNARYWDLSLVCKAMSKARSDRVQQNLAIDETEELVAGLAEMSD